jgi:general stress protein YciG
MFIVMAKKKNSAAMELGRLGGQRKVAKGFSMMNAEQRAEAGKKGAETRWGKKKPVKKSALT